MRKRIWTGILTLAMLLSLPYPIQASDINDDTTAEATIKLSEATEESTESDAHELPPLTYWGEEESAVSSILADMPRAQQGDTALESQYISPYITEVKNQNPYGTCWAFAFVSASEADIWKKGLGDSSTDLSEFQLAYFMSHTVTDPLGGTEGDSFKAGTSTTNYLNIGGNQELTTRRVANWQGLVAETEAPYTTVYANENATLDSNLAYTKDIVHLENAYWISMQDRDIVKELIKEYGACAASYRHDSNYYNTSSYWYAEEPVAEYCPSSVSTTTNHAITIIG